MARALRVITIQRGLDPRGFTLTSFGGAGGLHVCALADALGIRDALVPIHAGVLSALGMLVAPPGRTLTRSWMALCETLTDRDMETGLAQLAERGVHELVAEGSARPGISVTSSLDLRYQGQSHTLNLPWRGLEATIESFHVRHAELYGHRLGIPLELVNLRVRVRTPSRRLSLPTTAAVERSTPRPVRRLCAYEIADPVPVYTRDSLGAARQIEGPAVVTDPVATVWIAPRWWAQKDAVGNLWLRRRST
jgi:N-methylhydantoinase A